MTVLFDNMWLEQMFETVQLMTVREEMLTYFSSELDIISSLEKVYEIVNIGH
jgi:hypothetical protein